MPLYIRSNVAWTPNSLREESFQLDDNDFVLDPDQQRDVLPQPYRLVDRILCTLIDDVWDQLSERQSERIADASRFKPPQYECAIHVETDSSTPPSRSECMSVTSDGQFIIVGRIDGLSAINAESQQTLDSWVDHDLNITALHTSSLAEGKHLITTIDDMGQARLFALAGNQLYLLSTINEGSSENKMIASMCETSPEGDYLITFLQKPSSQEGWLEVHKLPKDAWIKDLDHLLAKTVQKEASQEDALDTAADGGDLTGRSGDSSDEQTAQRSNRSAHKFVPTTMHCKVLPPTELTGATHTSVQQGCKTVDSSCDVIGSGSHHLITTSHLEQRQFIFAQENENLMKYLPKETSKPLIQPTCHFLQPGRVLPQGMDSNNHAGQPGYLAVWWSQGTQLVLYSLIKPAKDLERKPDVVLSLSATIMASEVSHEGSKVALALDNNNLVVWDMYFGTPKGVMHLEDEGHVTNVTFLDPSVCPQDNKEYPPYPLTTNYYVMVAMDNGHLYLVNCGHMEEPPVSVDLTVTRDNQIPTICRPVEGLPQLLLTSRKNGRIFIQDLLHGNQLCEIVLPAEYELATPWQPQISIGANGRMLYLKGQMKTPPPASLPDDEPQGPQVAPPETGLFVFQLRSFPTLDKYRDCQRPVIPFVVHNMVDNRVDALLKERISQQGVRLSRMQSRWSNFKQQISSIQEMQEKANKKALKNAYSPSSVVQSPMMVGRFP